MDTTPFTAVDVDSAGFVYVSGITESVDFPVLQPIQRQLGGGRDGFVAKYAPSGGGLVYATYLGGSGFDEATGIAVDDAECAYVTGSTDSENFPVRNAEQPENAGGFDAFICAVSVSGEQLSYATDLGGTGFDVGQDLVARPDGLITIVGATDSADFPTPDNGPVSAQRADALAVQLDTEGRLISPRLIGGAGMDVAGAVAQSPTGEICVVGQTGSKDFPRHRGFWHKGVGGEVGFAVELDADLAQVRFSTYLGPGGDQVAKAVAANPDGDWYVAGIVNLGRIPLIHPVQRDRTGATDIFIQRLTSHSGGLRFSTYFGGSEQVSEEASGSEVARGIAVAPGGGVFVCGDTASQSFPVTGSSRASTVEFDAFLLRLDDGPPRGRVRAQPGKVSFGRVRIGASRSVSFDLRNTEQGPLQLTVGSAPEPYAVVSGQGAAVLRPGERRRVVVSFSPTSTGAVRASLPVVTKTSHGVIWIGLTGIGR